MSGDANFLMKVTGLTLGGFIQPSIARSLLEQPANVDKGVCQRFMWFSPQQVSVPFEKLEKVNEEFSTSVGKSYLHVHVQSSYHELTVYHVK